ncbi:hypothetical protein [Streptomyces pinistramenti]|nr:hypothetical protein [Streptomyces pinistramenti]
MTKPHRDQPPKKHGDAPEEARREELAESVRKLNRWSSGGGGRR